MRAAAVSLALAVLVWPARAFPCGSGSSGSSGSSSSGSSSSGSSSSSSSNSGSSSTPACVEVSSVVGRAQCSSFGAWDVSRRQPRVQLAIGTSLHWFPIGGLSFAGVADHDDGVAYRMLGEQVSQGRGVTAVTFDMRATASLGRYLYLGGEGSIGKAHLVGARLARPDTLVLEPEGSLYGSGGVVAGLAVPVGRYKVRVEALAGRRLVGLSVTSRHLDCVDESVVYDGSWVLEERAAIETWLTPWVSLGATVGSSALQRGDVSAGVFVQGHVRAFDGARGRR